MARIIDKINERRRAPMQRQRDDDDAKHRQPLYYSFEFFPPKTEAGLDNLLKRMDRMARRLDPLFIDVTWGAQGSTAVRSLAVASHAQRFGGVNVLLHLTCAGMSREATLHALQQCKVSGIRNLLVLRGDPPRGTRCWKPNSTAGAFFDRAIDMVQFIRQEYGDWFGIAVAGHPEGHAASTSREQELVHLKEKMDAGADLIISQFFYNVEVFQQFVRDCRGVGITAPILPGILPIQSFSAFTRMTEYCNTSVPSHVMDRLEPVKYDDEAVKDIGVEIAVDMCRQLLENDGDDIDGIHFYTLNLERSVTRILLGMGVIEDVTLPEQGETRNERSVSLSDVVPTSRPLPWRPSAMEERIREEVRPINWANRPKSYVMRTETWDEFPNGRWGDSTSPAFGELSEVSHFYNFSIPFEDRLSTLGAKPKLATDVYEVFAKYVEGTVAFIPWCDTPLQPESFLIQQQLAQLNRAGFLTINSQPTVNGQSSTHSTFGWGGPGGYVYQKAYVECFVSPDNTEKLFRMVNEQHPAMNLYAINAFGKELRGGGTEGGTTALTWGVFPNREIVQPTIFDPDTFKVWAEEAFSLWTTMWLDLYELDSDAYDLIETIRDSYYLVAIIDNDFVAKDGSQIWNALFQVASIT